MQFWKPFRHTNKLANYNRCKILIGSVFFLHIWLSDNNFGHEINFSNHNIRDKIFKWQGKLCQVFPNEQFIYACLNNEIAKICKCYCELIPWQSVSWNVKANQASQIKCQLYLFYCNCSGGCLLQRFINTFHIF